MPITRTVLDVAARHPDRLAIVGDDGRLTYAGLVEDSRRLFAVVDALHRAQSAPPAPAPEARGVPITAVSVESAFHAARIVADLAGFRAISAIVDPRWPLAHRAGVVVATGVGVVVSDSEELAAELAARGWTGTIVSPAELRHRESLVTPAPPPRVRDAEEPFLMLFSSGTTSDPKAFLKTRDQYRANVAVSRAHLEPLPGVVTLAPGPVSYSLTLYAVIECLATGGTVCVADAFDPFDLGRRIRDEHVTRVVAVPAVAEAIADTARRDRGRLASLELVVTGGANLSSGTRERLGASLPRVRLISYYGAAEIGFIGDSRDGDGTAIDVYDGIGVRICDADGAEVPDGRPGTIWVRAAACSDGYVSGTTDVALRGADGWATVHDRGRIVGGRLVLAGRVGDIAVTGGHKVALPDVERAFDDLAGLGAVCAVALEDARLGSAVALVAEGGPDDVPPRSVLLAHARTRLAPQFVPHGWYRLDRLPRTVGGKVRRHETAELVERGEAVRL